LLKSYGQASKNINGSNSFKLEPVVLYNLGPIFIFEESMELPTVDVMKVVAEQFA